MQPMLLVFPEILTKAKEHVKDIISLNVFDFFGMTVKEFLQLQENKLPKRIEKLLKKRSTTFFDYIRIVNAFEQGAKHFQDIIEVTNIQESADEQAAKGGLIELTAEEAMLTFICDYFKLSSLDAAQNITLYEYITARKINFNNIKFQRNLNEIQKIKK